MRNVAHHTGESTVPRAKGSKGATNKLRWVIVCDLCGTTKRVKKEHARFCSSKCRQADYRIRKAAEVLYREQVTSEEVARLQRLALQAAEAGKPDSARKNSA